MTRNLALLVDLCSSLTGLTCRHYVCSAQTLPKDIYDKRHGLLPRILILHHLHLAPSETQHFVMHVMNVSDVSVQRRLQRFEDCTVIATYCAPSPQHSSSNIISPSSHGGVMSAGLQSNSKPPQLNSPSPMGAWRVPNGHASEIDSTRTLYHPAFASQQRGAYMSPADTGTSHHHRRAQSLTMHSTDQVSGANGTVISPQLAGNGLSFTGAHTDQHSLQDHTGIRYRPLPLQLRDHFTLELMPDRRFFSQIQLYLKMHQARSYVPHVPAGPVHTPSNSTAAGIGSDNGAAAAAAASVLRSGRADSASQHRSHGDTSVKIVVDHAHDPSHGPVGAGTGPSQPLIIQPAVLSQLAKRVTISHAVLQYARDIIICVRQHCKVAIGPSPLATPILQHAARMHALLSGESFVRPSDLDAVAVHVLAHRVTLVRSVDPQSARAVVAHLVSRVLNPPK